MQNPMDQFLGAMRGLKNKDASRQGNSHRQTIQPWFISQPSRNVTQRMASGGWASDFRGREPKPVVMVTTVTCMWNDPAVFTEMIQAAKRDLGPLGPQVTDYTEMETVTAVSGCAFLTMDILVSP